MRTLRVVLPFLLVHALAADDISNIYNDESFEHNQYARAVNDIDLDTDIGIHERSRRQTQPSADKEYYVTQCGYDNQEQPDGPSVQVLGKSLEINGAALAAAKVVHLLVRFMPRKIFLTIAANNTIGVFPTRDLPANLFPEFTENMPSICGGKCGIQFQNDQQVDCSPWCTTPEYPYQNTAYSINYLWAYGNFSRLFVVETNVVCEGFNPSGSENLLIREFGFMLMTRILDNKTVTDIKNAYTAATANFTWAGVKNEYEYFMLGTLAWFNGAGRNNLLKGMACLNIIGSNGRNLCSDAYGQRQFIKQRDSKLYKLLNYIYNNNREYVNGDTSLCEKANNIP
ncbi:uncharacterized protein LOC132756153 [Ruditapes philippinarum]|uniref:uncharacterized protein LOC132756153 n=1 Tax=Ruditapes philippinarum TaxID=129788 RepID=UPI00295A8123|nr:uncharacterized protein LOC132756153 [Ruditapes philippinarum]